MTPVSKLLGIIIPAILAFSSPVWAKSSGFCLECHSSLALENFTESVPVEERSVYQARMEPCPGIRSLSEEAFFTEGRIVKIGEILKRMEEEGWSTEILRKENGRGADAFSRFQTQEIQSLGEYARKSSAVRSGLQKVYDQTLQKRAESSRRWLIGIGVLVFLTLMFLLGLGIKKLNRMGKVLSVIFLLGATIVSGACSSNPAESSKKNPVQESLEESLSLARQLSAKAEEGGYQSVLLSQMAEDWSRIDPAGSSQAFDLAWKMALKNREQDAQIQTLRGILAPWPDATEARKKKVKFETVLDLQDEIRNSEGFTWPLRSVAEEWVRARDKKGIPALEWIGQKISLIKDPEVHDRESKSLAETWAQLDEEKAWDVCRTISDPFLRASALVNLALFIRNEDRAGNLVREAWKAGETVSSPFTRCKVLARIGAAGSRVLPREKKFWAGQVEAEIQRIKDPLLRSMVLQESVYAWAPVDRGQAEHWTGAIPAAFGEGKAYSYLFLSRRDGIPRSESLALLKKAWVETERIEDVFQIQKIRGLVGKTLARVAPEEALRALPQIDDPFYRSEVLREAAERVEDREEARALAERIPLEALRYRAGIRIIDRSGPKDWEKIRAFAGEAFTAAQSIPDPYVRAKALIEVAKEAQQSERLAANQVLELALKSTGQIASLALRTEILESSAEAWKTFDSAHRLSILGQVDPSVSGTRRKLEEIRLWAKTDPLKARQMADQIPSGFPYERLSAYKEVLSALRKSQNPGLKEVFSLAWQQALDLSPDQGRAKVLSQLSAEAGTWDGETGLLQLKQLPDRNLRDTLLKETGLIRARENPAQALQIAREISESSARLAVYRKISEALAQNPERMRAKGTESSFIPMLTSWGMAREKAKRGELEAVPFFETALGELERLPESRERSYLFSALATDWAAIDEKKALKVAEKISGENLAEPFSYALLAVAGQYKKWSRREAESLLQKTLSETKKISDPYLRAQRMFQIAKEWRVINRIAAKETLVRAEEEARRIPLAGKEPPFLLTILMEGVAWEPETALEISRKAGAPRLASKILLEGARTLRERTLDPDRKYLEKALQWAQREKNIPLMGEVAAAWYKLNPLKGIEILGQIEARDVRVQTLGRIAAAAETKEERVRLLDRAVEEIGFVDGLTRKIQLLKTIAEDMARLDKDRAKSVYSNAYQMLDREYRSYP